MYYDLKKKSYYLVKEELTYLNNLAQKSKNLKTYRKPVPITYWK